MKSEKSGLPLLFISIVLPVALLLIVTACKPQQLPSQISVGTLMAESGNWAEFGPVIRNGVILAAEQLSAAGLEVTLIHADSGTDDPVTAVAAAEKLVTGDKVSAIIGPLGSSETTAVAESVSCPQGVILVSPSATTLVLTDLPADRGKDVVFRTCPSDDLQGKIAGRTAAKMFSKISVIYSDNSYGLGLMESFRRSFEAAGKEVVAALPVEQRLKTYEPVLVKLLAPEPDALAAFTSPESAEVYLSEAINLHTFTKFFFCNMTRSEKLITALGAENLEGMFGTAPASSDSASLDAFDDAYRKKFGQIQPVPFIPNAYDAMATIGLAAYMAYAQGKKITPAAIRDNLRAVSCPPGEVIKPGEFEKAFSLIKKGTDINYEGAAGPVDYDGYGDVVTPYEIWKYAGGKIVTVRIE